MEVTKICLAGGAIIELGDGFEFCHDIDIAGRQDRYLIATANGGAFEIRVPWRTPDWKILGMAFEPVLFEKLAANVQV